MAAHYVAWRVCFIAVALRFIATAGRTRLVILKQKGVMQMNRLLQTSDRDIFMKLLQLDVCKPTRLHHLFLL